MEDLPLCEPSSISPRTFEPAGHSGPVQKALIRGTAIDSSCAPSSPAGPAWLEPCRYLNSTPRRRHHRQPRNRAGRVKIDHPRVTFFEGSITDLDLLMEVFPGAAGIFGGDPVRVPIGERPARLERGKRDRHRQGARGGEGLRGARRRRRLILLGLQRHPGPLWVNGTRKLLYIGDSGGCGRHMPAVRNCPDTATGICA